jgi:hypothetical protein
MSLFVIADITNPKSAPLELQATVPDLPDTVCSNNSGGRETIFNAK